MRDGRRQHEVPLEVQEFEAANSRQINGVDPRHGKSSYPEPCHQPRDDLRLAILGKGKDASVVQVSATTKQIGLCDMNDPGS